MIVADVFLGFLLVIAAQAIVLAHWAIAGALFPERARRASAGFQHPLRSLLVGLLASVPLVGGGVAVMSAVGGHPLGNLVGLGMIFGAVLMGLFGSSGLALLVGRGIGETAQINSILRGGLALVFAFLLPPFFWLPLVLLAGLGAWVKPPVAPPEATPATSPGEQAHEAPAPDLAPPSAPRIAPEDLHKPLPGTGQVV